MKVLIVHTEARYFAGAQKVLGYFLEGAKATTNIEPGLALVPSARVSSLIPVGCAKFELPENQQFGLLRWLRQGWALARIAQRWECALLHGWTARDWETAALAGLLARRPVLGTLHDHPRAAFISRGRARLMQAAAAVGLQRVVCVSEALRAACVQAGYPGKRIDVVPNGLPAVASVSRATLHREGDAARAGLRFGFLGAFSRRKGLAEMFEMLEALARSVPEGWTLRVAGGAQDTEGERLLAEVRERHGGRPWWRHVEWVGWVGAPVEFLAGIDVLVCPSVQFDPFPTVLLEAAWAGVPVLATRVGGIPEIVENGTGGWLIEPGAWAEGAAVLRRLVADPALATRAGAAHRERAMRLFTVERMMTGYEQVYRQLAT